MGWHVWGMVSGVCMSMWPGKLWGVWLGTGLRSPQSASCWKLPLRHFHPPWLHRPLHFRFFQIKGADLRWLVRVLVLLITRASFVLNIYQYNLLWIFEKCQKHKIINQELYYCYYSVFFNLWSLTLLPLLHLFTCLPVYISIYSTISFWNREDLIDSIFT